MNNTQELINAAREAADTIESYVKNEYGWPKMHPANERRYNRDMEQVTELSDLCAAIEQDSCMRKESGWLDIDSAPKDGNRILLYGTFQWDAPSMREPQQTGIVVGYLNAEGLWILVNANPYWDYCQPTHWMPLPDEPKFFNKEKQNEQGLHNAANAARSDTSCEVRRTRDLVEAIERSNLCAAASASPFED